VIAAAPATAGECRRLLAVDPRPLMECLERRLGQRDRQLGSPYLSVNRSSLMASDEAGTVTVADHPGDVKPGKRSQYLETCRVEMRDTMVSETEPLTALPRRVAARTWARQPSRWGSVVDDEALETQDVRMAIPISRQRDAHPDLVAVARRMVS